MANFKIDRENKTFVFDDGEVLPIPKDKVNQVLRTPHARKIYDEELEYARKTGPESSLIPSLAAMKQSAEDMYLGNLPRTAWNYTRSLAGAFSPGEGQEDLSFKDRILDKFYALQEPYQVTAAERDKNYPVASGIGKGIGFLGEVGSLGNMRAAAALPIMGAAHSETSFLEPGQKATEVSRDAILGFAMDKFFGGLGKIAGARGAMRDEAANISRAEAANAAELQRATLANDAEASRFARESAAQPALVSQAEALQAAENKAWVQSTEQKMEKVAQTLGKTPVEASALGVEGFIENSIERSVHAGSSEGNYVAKFLRSIFKGDGSGKMTADNLKKGVTALDQAIVAQEGVTKDLLINFRNELIQEMPERVANSFIYEKWGTKIFNYITDVASGAERNLINAFSSAPASIQKLIKSFGKDVGTKLTESVNNSIKQVLEKYKGNLVEAIKNGTIRKEIESAILNNPIYQNVRNKIPSMSSDATRGMDYLRLRDYEKVDAALFKYAQNIIEKTESVLNKNTIQIHLEQQAKLGTIGKNVQNIPASPNVVPMPPNVAPAQTVTPNLQQVPTMSAPQGVYGRLAQGLENLPGFGDTLRTARRNAPAAAAASFAGIPVAKTVAAGLGAAKVAEVATRPGVTANAVRAGFKLAGVGALDAMAQSYPSYNRGVLENPQERRSFTKQIESDDEIPIEDKAILISNVNRGKPIGSRL